MSRRIFALCAALITVLMPALARAEVSVHLDQQGRLKRVVYLTRGSGASAVVWGQVRGRLPIEVLLNPLGDNLGDLPPTIAVNPTTGFPWVVWPQNVGNQKRLAFSMWNGKSWTTPTRIVAPDDLGSDQVEPRLLFDPSGVPYLVFAEAARPGRILFMTVARGAWTRPVVLSDVKVDSRHPAALLQGGDLNLTYTTAAGTVDHRLPTAALLESATGLMDSPIPPGAQPTPPDPGNPTEEPPAQIFIHR